MGPIVFHALPGCLESMAELIHNGKDRGDAVTTSGHLECVGHSTVVAVSNTSNVRVVEVDQCVGY